MIQETYNQTVFIYPNENIKNYWDNVAKNQAIEIINRKVTQ